MSTILNLVIFISLIFLTAFFVATEFAIVKIRSSRVDQLVLEGRKGSKAAKHVTSHLDEYLSACQLGITVTALGIGMVGEKTFEFMLHPLFEFIGLPIGAITVLTVATAFSIATFAHVVIGELAPKTIAIQKAETVVLLLSGPIRFFYKLMFPFIWFLNGSARLLLKLIGMSPASEHDESFTEEELKILMKESYQSGEINKTELTYVNNIFSFDQMLAKSIMVPRTEMVALEDSISLDSLMTTIQTEQYTRYPVYEESKDKVVGFLNIKDLLTSDYKRDLKPNDFSILDWTNPIIRVIETISIQELFQKMKKEQIHMAILMDEYGGTSGLVTIEDIIEVLVGEIRDEFDADEINDIQVMNESEWVVQGSCSLEKIEPLLNLKFNNDNLDTIGGWYLHQNTDFKEAYIEYEGYSFSIKESVNSSIGSMRIKKI